MSRQQSTAYPAECAVLFDLDGTFADTAHDMAFAINRFLDLVAELERETIPWGIVTNKPAWLTDPLMAAMGLSERAACVVSGDTTPNPKPHPALIHYACRVIDQDPANCWYVGDAERDIVSGRAAGLFALVALFGYIGEDADPRTWGADGLIETPTEVLDWLTRSWIR